MSRRDDPTVLFCCHVDTVPAGEPRFWTETGSVFEEISTTIQKSDSMYRDPNINKLTSAQRKTIVDHWGRFQLTEQIRSAAIPQSE